MSPSVVVIAVHAAVRAGALVTLFAAAAAIALSLAAAAVVFALVFAAAAILRFLTAAQTAAFAVCEIAVRAVAVALGLYGMAGHGIASAAAMIEKEHKTPP